ncbi:hypothetical protein PCANC_25283 [Puccinia coronata f. sp. avenae]|uniref:Uncharacterized protein n=1 Tax=Puccinia coronata f. sp. avenae TaxID=200324 RepID=A0A2N5U510_9BASI|nr:hypothetical protein PCASD_25045 [Puccinia coronata f. sp. avenae]PLW32864.1 hypothetical protein PCANC_25283 [Puccinia coronata f. sp. avenae]PLW49594.1 hypothetical protein PCASD_02173 [Puccinia coronata f. sp. avenae]
MSSLNILSHLAADFPGSVRSEMKPLSSPERCSITGWKNRATTSNIPEQFPFTLNCLILLQQVLTSAQDEVNMDRPNRVSSDLRARKAISEYQPRCNSKRCAEGEHNWFEASIDEPHYSIRPPFRQSAPVKCTDTGLPPPCVPKLKKARGLEVDHADPK